MPQSVRPRSSAIGFPAPLFGSVDQIGLERVAFNMPAGRPKMFVVQDGKGFESSLIKMKGSGISR